MVASVPTSAAFHPFDGCSGHVGILYIIGFDLFFSLLRIIVM
jgi:hypothetical protein